MAAPVAEASSSTVMAAAENPTRHGGTATATVVVEASENPTRHDGMGMEALLGESMATLGENPTQPAALVALAAEAVASMAKLKEAAAAAAAENPACPRAKAVARRVAEAAASMKKMAAAMAEKEEEEEEEEEDEEEAALRPGEAPEAENLDLAPGDGGVSAGASLNEIMQTGEILLWGFIQERVERYGDPQAIALSQRELGGGPPKTPPPSPKTKRLIECLRRIGDKLDANTELQSIFEEVGCQDLKGLFFEVAVGIFADGVFNWGRIVTVLYFAYKLAVKALGLKIPELVRTIVGWTMEFLREHVLTWIQAQGGWESLLSYIINLNWKKIAKFVAAALVAALAVWKMS